MTAMKMNTFRTFAMAAAMLLPVLAGCDDDDEITQVPESDFSTTLSGAEEVPAVTTPATGTATLEVDGDEIDYSIDVTDLENASVAHIHIAPVGQNGPVRLNLCGTGAPQPPCTSGTGVLAAGSNGTTVGDPAISFDSLVSAIRAGNAYVNVHTSAPGCTTGQPGCNPGGEIRGQIEED
jgi:hypothetical protein